MERASCSDSCPGLFSQLKEVYLFGCNTLNADATKTMSSEVGRSLVRAGHSQADAKRLARTLDQRHGESSRDRMRRIFTNVPVIYGFSSVAPLGPRVGGPARPLPAVFVAGGDRQWPREPAAARHLCRRIDDRRQRPQRRRILAPSHRREVCQFVDDRLSPAEKLAFIHGLLRRDMAEVRMFLERIEGLFASLSADERQDACVRRCARRDRAATTSRATGSCASRRMPICRRFAPA